MKKISKLLVVSIMTIICISLVVFAGVKSKANAEEQSINDQAEQIYNNMDASERICQILCVHAHTWNGEPMTKIFPDFAKILQDYHFGGMVLFGENTKTTEDLFGLVHDAQENTMSTHAGSSQTGLPMIIDFDQEGGAVFRLYTGTNCMGNMALGATQDITAASNSAKIIAKELKSMAVNTTLAPSVDVNSNPGNPIIGLRSFGDDPNKVANLGTAFAKNCNENGVIACAKHFPGHGDVDTDSHTGLPCNYKYLDDLEATDLIPFEKCIKDGGVEMIMSAHIQFPNIDKTKVPIEKPQEDQSMKEIIVPATISHTFMTDILRDKLGFKGLACTDAISMKALRSFFYEPTIIKYALEAGNDMIYEPIIADNDASYREIADNIIVEINNWTKDPLHEQRLKEACTNVIKTKIKTGIIDYKASDYSLDKAINTLRNPDSLATEYEDTAKSITLIKNNNNVLPIKLNKDSKIAYLTQNSTSATNANRQSSGSFAIAWNRLKSNGLIPEGNNPNIITYNMDPSKGTVTPMETLTNAIDKADYVITDSGVNANTQMGYLSWQTNTPNEIVKYAHSKGKKTVVISVRLPYDCQLYPDSDAIICVYNYVGTVFDYQKVLEYGTTTSSEVCGPSLIEGVECIFGNIAPKGKLPINVKEFNYNKDKPGYNNKIIYPNGYGLNFGNNTGQIFNINNTDIQLEYTFIDADGTAKCPKVTIKTDDQKNITYNNNGENDVKKYFTIPIARDSKTFAENKDFKVEYKNNIEVGTATATITGTGDIIGSKTVNFTINKQKEPDPKPEDPGNNSNAGNNITAQTFDYTYLLTAIFASLAIISGCVLGYLRKHQ